MASTTTSKCARRNARSHSLRGRKSLMKQACSSPRSPRSTSIFTRRKTPGAATGRGKISAVARNNKRTKRAERKISSPRLWKYSNIAMRLQSTEPFEKNCLQREPMPDNYVFVPRGDVYVTRNCRSQTKESRRQVYKVYDNAGKTPLGIRVPSDVHATVLQSAAETADSRANAVKLRDEKDLARSRQILREQFPLMPAESLDTILDHAFLKGSGRVGRTSTTTDERKAILAVEAHIRHTHTPYESLLKDGKGRDEARKAVWEMVQAVRAAWEGHGTQPMGLLALRSRVD